MKRKEMVTGLLLIAPFLIGFLLFFVIPFGITIIYSLNCGNSMGFQNYRAVYASGLFRLAAFNTLKFHLVSLPLMMLLSITVALILKKGVRWGKGIKTSLLFPMLTPIVSTVIIIEVVFADEGLLNHIIGRLGPGNRSWIHSPNAFPLMVALFLWKNTGYNIIIILSGLYMIPDDYYAYAKTEGIGPVQSFRHITLPSAGNTLLFALLMSLLNSFKSFREAFLIGGKYPDDSIYMLQHFMNNNFENMNYSRLSVAAVTTAGAIFGVIAVVWLIKILMGLEPARVRGAANEKEGSCA